MVDESENFHAKGGKARAEKLTPGERSEIARKAARAKWDANLPQATHEGDIKIGEASIPCAVLEDGRRVLTQSGFMRALGRARQAKGRQYYKGDVNLPAFLTAQNLKPFISKELEVTSSQIEFRTVRGVKAFGYPAELLTKVCEVFLKARDAGSVLTHNQRPVAAKAEMLIRGLADTGIVALVDEATGFQNVRPRDALQTYLEMILRKELAAWSKKFPDEFYENIYALKGWKWPGMGTNRYSVVARYTTNLIYERLAPGLLDELKRRSPKDEKGNRKNRLHEWLNDDFGNPLLAQHVHAVVMFQRLAIKTGRTWEQFLRMVDQTMPKKGNTLELDLRPLPSPSAPVQPLPPPPGAASQ
jgi:hypothetical protein